MTSKNGVSQWYMRVSAFVSIGECGGLSCSGFPITGANYTTFSLTYKIQSNGCVPKVHVCVSGGKIYDIVTPNGSYFPLKKGTLLP